MTETDELYRCCCSRQRITFAVHPIGDLQCESFRQASQPVSTMATMNAILTRYYEQLDTTYETMRRRAVSNCDTLVKLAEKSRVVGDRLREYAEVTYFDLKEQVTAAVAEQSLDSLKTDRDTRNSIVELYLGCAVSSLAVCVGLLCGAYTFPTVLTAIFSPLVELTLFAVLPLYAALYLRKYGEGDGSERRLVVFTMTLAMSTIAGHLLDSKAINLAPAMMFIPPVVLSLFVDTDFTLTHQLATDRAHFIGISGGIAAGAIAICAYATGSLAFAVLVFVAAHLAWLAFHFQLTTAAAQGKNFQQGDYEVLYVAGLVVIYALIAMCTSAVVVEGDIARSQ